ncbi:Na+/H+ antiporter subunit E [Corynebacterium alimapuense]|uniref:Na+/H+ antiporter subunit E n=1 Tax=Corynebacterium alimapuense TaxID=1576874 RepID=A0A3M8K9K7_9CORY|nr:Na+/H+ antiporter subunit E [Corynebacterium alimapuense]RNE49903.1 Na+/H+ antiporter subunit E [Corynebacterium alimapuense]
MLSGFSHRFHPWFVVWITIMWCLLMGELTWANLIGGLLVGIAVVMALPLPAMPTAGQGVRWLSLFGYLVIWNRDLLVASFKVAWLSLRPAPLPRTAIVKVPMRVSSELVLSFATALYNLQPGGAVSDIDIANRTWTVHLLNAGSDEALRHELNLIADLERRMIHIFERS